MTRIALISDIHFGKFSRTTELSVPGEPIKDESTGGESLVKSMISLLKSQNIDYLCVAGDLTSIGSPQEFLYCEKKIKDIADEIGISKEKVIVGLGNHDVDWNISELYKKFDTSISGFPVELVMGKYQHIAANVSTICMTELSMPKNGPAPCSGIIDNDDFIMFVLNTGWCCNRDQKFAHGKLDKIQLEWFKEEAKKYKSDKRWKVILLHHHPRRYTYIVSEEDISLIEESSEFLEIASENGFQLILHGHRHHPRAETNLIMPGDEYITFICAGSFSVNATHRNSGDTPNTLHIIELTDEVGVLKLLNYQYSLSEGWIPIKDNCSATPIDRVMYLGRRFKTDEIESAINDLTENTVVLCWENLDERLRFIPPKKLNELIVKQLSESHNMIGRFPDDVVLVKK